MTKGIKNRPKRQMRAYPESTHFLRKLALEMQKHTGRKASMADAQELLIKKNKCSLSELVSDH